MSMFARLIALLGALAAWSGLGAQLYILLIGPLGPIGGVWRFLAFFTIAMNLFSVSQLTWVLLKPQLSPRRVQLMSAATSYMAVGCIVYALILQELWDPEGLQLFADIALHYAAPLLTILFWLLAVPKTGLNWADAITWLIGPAAYFAYALVRGAFDGFYPYPFIDVAELGWTKVALNAFGVLALFLAVGITLVAIAQLSMRRRKPLRA